MIIEKYKQINNNIYCFVMDSYDKFKFFPYRVPIVYSRGGETDVRINLLMIFRMNQNMI